MNEPIINPLIFYLVEVLDNVHVISCIASILIIIGIGVFLMFIMMGELDYKLHRKKFIGTVVALIVCATLAVFIPAKSTIYTMLIAKEVTYGRVDKIIKAGKDVRESLKQDIIDILKELEEKGKKE